MSKNYSAGLTRNIWEQYDYLENEIKATIIEDSVYNGRRITTMLWRVPRFLLPQLNTYRAFSRNVESNRARRFSKTSKEVLENPYVPYVWQVDHKGMQGAEQITGWKANLANFIWKLSSKTQVLYATILSWLGVSKQYTNRLIETYMYVDYLITSTDFENFLAQRDNYHAQLEIQVLARRVKEALLISKPKVVSPGKWVLPFVSEEERKTYSLFECINFSVARCARVSYQLKTNNFNIQTDINLAIRLAKDTHLSPFEHQICAIEGNGGNLIGVTQLRKILEKVLAENSCYSHEFLEREINEHYLCRSSVATCGSCGLRCPGSCK